VKRSLWVLVGSSLVAQILAAQPRISLNKTVFRSGQTIRIEIREKQEPSVTASLIDAPSKFFKESRSRWRALIPIPMNQKAGEGQVTFSGETDRGPQEWQPMKFEVLGSTAEIERISFPRSKQKLLNDPSEEKESALIRALLKEAAETDPSQHWKGRFVKPVVGRIISRFGVQRDKSGQINKKDFHRGIDFAAKRGEVVRAANAGTVLLAKDLYFHGNTILLNHGQGVGSIYIHLDSILVKTGDKVRRGDRIGRVGSSGLATAPHLHWGVYVNASAVDPVQWLEEKF